MIDRASTVHDFFRFLRNMRDA